MAMDATEKERASLDRMIQDYLAAFNSGDYKRVAQYWTEDAVHVPPIGDEIRGRPALEEFYRQSCENMKAQLSDHTYECRFAGDCAMVRESFKVTVTPPGEATTTARGNGMWIARKESDGVWRTFWGLARMADPMTL
jgi:uncharacterized protein (TIGR02246 family)